MSAHAQTIGNLASSRFSGDLMWQDADGCIVTEEEAQGIYYGLNGSARHAISWGNNSFRQSRVSCIIDIEVQAGYLILGLILQQFATHLFHHGAFL